MPVRLRQQGFKATRALIAEIDHSQEEKKMAEAQANEGNQKSYTQEEIDSIVEGRLARERQKYADYEELKSKAAKYDATLSDSQKTQDKLTKLETELAGMKKTEKIRSIRAKVSKDAGIPEELLTGEDEDSCKAQAEAILKFAKGSKYPGVKETKHETGQHQGAGSDTTSEDFRELAGQMFGRKE